MNRSFLQQCVRWEEDCMCMKTENVTQKVKKLKTFLFTLTMIASSAGCWASERRVMDPKRTTRFSGGFFSLSDWFMCCRRTWTFLNVIIIAVLLSVSLRHDKCKQTTVELSGGFYFVPVELLLICLQIKATFSTLLSPGTKTYHRFLNAVLQICFSLRRSCSMFDIHSLW